MNLDFSVVVCTYGRYDLVLNCLECISRVRYDCSRFEVIVVDNNPPDKRVDHDWVARGVGKYVTEDTPGLSRARNAGIHAASGEIIVFLDDDAEVTDGWLTELRHAFEGHPDALVVGGKVTAKYVNEKPSWMTAKLEQYLSCIDWGEGVIRLLGHQWIVGANMALRRTVFERYGAFDLSLGRSGSGTLLSNEEIALFDKLPTGSIYYASAAEVFHLIPTERTRQVWFRKRVFWQAISDLMSNRVPPRSSHYFFDRFADSLPLVPAQHRSLRSLCYPCGDGDEFERQLRMIYDFIVSAGQGQDDQV
jgi:glycosyltransferase involved in cell wall biosynthesis